VYSVLWPDFIQIIVREYDGQGPINCYYAGPETT